ncbi:MAG: DUF4340 domain-containing protein [Deltaproteobacteria bacterium]|nr:MAG: DUF4340 domain-containing protein [Deltaproteobacteria bacterium]
MKRINLWLSVVLAGQIVVFGLGYAFCGGEQVEKAERKLLLAGIDRNRLEKVTIKEEGDKKIVLARKGEDWILPEKYDFPVDSDKIDRVLGQLLGLESVYLVSKNDTHHRKFEVAPAKFRRKVTLEGDGIVKTLFVGNTGATGYTHVRLSDQNEVWAVDDLKYWELGTRVSDWARRKIVDEDEKRVASLVIKKGGKAYRLERTNLSSWTLDGKKAKKAEGDTLARKSVKIELSDILGPKDSDEVKKKLDSGKEPVEIEVALAAEQLPETEAKKEGESGQTKDDSKDEGTGSGEESSEKKESSAPEINQKLSIRIWKNPDKSSAAYLVSSNSKYAFEVDMWRVRKFFDFDPEKALEADSSQGGKGNKK